MDTERLMTVLINTRQAIRNFLLVATMEELKREKEISLERRDYFRAECIQELIDEHTSTREAARVR